MGRKRGRGIVEAFMGLGALALFGTRPGVPPVPSVPGSTIPPGLTIPVPVVVSKHRILTGERILFRFRCQPPTSTGTFTCSARIVYDDGTTEDWSSTYINNSTSSSNIFVARDIFLGEDRTGTTIVAGKPPRIARRNGFVTSLSVVQTAGTTFLYGMGYVEAFIPVASDTTQYRDRLARGYLYGVSTSRRQGTLVLDQDEPLDYGPQYAYVATIAEDATAGTHICTLTITTIAGSGIEIEFGRIVEGNTATAQTAVVFVNDAGAGSNRIFDVLLGGADVTASIAHNFPSSQPTSFAAVTVATPGSAYSGSALRIVGGASIVLQVTTSAVSVTQTFAIVFRVKGQIPSRTLQDTIGTSVNTVVTDAFYDS